MYMSIVREYGIRWIFNRTLYSVKLKIMKVIPKFENIFEKRVNIQRLDIFDIDVSRIETFLNKLSSFEKQNIILIADNARTGKILSFSSLELDYGNPINWHLNPITNVETYKNIKWYEVSDFDSQRGDIKVIWEASRFTHFFYFARAYMLTKDIKYYESFSIQLNDWLENNSYSCGINYKCGQEATLRMINALIVYSVFKKYGLTTIRDEMNLKKLVEGSYKKVLSNFFYAHKCIKNNHTLSEITGLIIGAWCSNDDKNVERAYKLMDKEIQTQFMADGGYIQFSFNYQRFALQIMECVNKISESTRIELSETSKKTIVDSAYLMYQMQSVNGDLPNYGSNDGALIFPVTTCDYRDFRPIINTIYSLFNNNRLYKPGNYDEEILWFSNSDNIGIDELDYVNLQKRTMRFKNAGLNVIRHNQGFLMIVLQKLTNRPGQMDQMHIDLWHKGINLLCDSGTYSYSENIGKKMSLTSGHNTVIVGGKEQMNKYGPFLIYDWTKLGNVILTEDSFEGTMISKNGYSHTRKIIKDENKYIIEDYVKTNIERVEVLLHTPCHVQQIDDCFNIINDKEIIAKIYTNEKVELRKTYRSLYYLKKEMINEIVINSYSNKSIKYSIELI